MSCRKIVIRFKKPRAYIYMYIYILVPLITMTNRKLQAARGLSFERVFIRDRYKIRVCTSLERVK